MSFDHHRHPRRGTSSSSLMLGVGMFLFTIVVSLFLPSIASAHPALTYTCGTPNDTNPHCYGENTFDTNVNFPPPGVSKYTGFNTFYGTYTSPNVVQLTGATDTYARLNEETWLIDIQMSGSVSPYHQCYMNYDSSTHTYSTASNCWSETGYQLVGDNWACTSPGTPAGCNPNTKHDAWFMSYLLPLDGLVLSPAHLPYCDPSNNGACVYTNVYGAQLQSTDYGNTFGDEQVWLDPATSHQMDTNADSTTTNMTIAVANDYINPNEITVGTELGGTNGLNGPKVHFKLNQYQSSLGGTWAYHTLDGYTQSNDPPHAYWVSGKKPSQTANGGDFLTCVLAVSC